MRNKIKSFITQLSDMNFSNIEFQMEDNHAWYFDAREEENDIVSEIKVEKEDYFASYRFEGNEDWREMDTLI